MQTRPASRQVNRASAALFGLIIAAATVALVVPLFQFDRGLKEGDVASRTFTAAHGKEFESQILTEAGQNERAQAVPEESLPVDTSLRDQQVDRAARFVDSVRAISSRTDLTAQQKQDQLANLSTPQPLANFERAALLNMDPARLLAFRQMVSSGLATLLSAPLKKDDIEKTVGAYADTVKEFTPGSSDERNALIGVMRVFSVETFRVDQPATDAKREQARQSVPPVVRTFSQGQVIVTEGQEISAQDIEALKATGVIEDGIDLYAVAGGILMALGLGALLGIYTYLFQPFTEPANRRMVLVAVTMAAVLIGARIALPAVTPDTSDRFFAFGLPVATAAIVTACFADLSLAVLVAVAVGLFAVFVGGTAPQIAGSSYVGSLQSLELGITYTAGGLAGAAVVYRANRVSRFAVAGLVVAGTTGGVMVVFWLVGAPRENVQLGWIAVAAAVHGLASAVLAVGVFVVLAMVFGVTTRLQLMELAQSEHPLLRRLQEEAPGTYHHSMLVGALAERAAGRIGADALLVRVGAYYHDIGKLAMPGNYVENMLDGAASPHDALASVESARIIRAHVTNGLDLARKYRLPSVVRDFIPQHHGTRLVTFFYRQAVEQGETIEPKDYRYDGPRPQSREAAIVMLADSSEAVARARQDEGAGGLDQMVDSVFAERLAEGQLDECDITLRELQVVAASFKATLRAVYHPRVQYPSPTADEIATLARGETPIASR
jgi:putative nucleotidyltransferase with HDIG domain